MELLFITTSIILILTGLTQVALLTSYHEPVWIFNSTPRKIKDTLYSLEEKRLALTIYYMMRVSWLVYIVMLFNVDGYMYIPIAIIFIIYHIMNLTVDISRYIISLNYLLILLLPWSTLL